MITAIFRNLGRLERIIPTRCVARSVTFNARSLNAVPQYTLYDQKCLLSFKVILPSFRLLANNTVVTDGNKKGAILLEWIPRAKDGTELFL